MSPRFFRLISALSALCAGHLHAGDAAADAKPEPYVLKNKSSFTPVTDEQRAPFWPIGWVKRRPVLAATGPVHVVEAPKVTLDAKSFKVTSILLGNPSFAIINGRTYSEGEFLRAPKAVAVAGAPSAPAAPAPRIRVYRINDGQVVLQNQEQLLTVSLLRPELLQRGGVEELLSEDRP
jgi:hypothetical protein